MKKKTPNSTNVGVLKSSLITNFTELRRLDNIRDHVVQEMEHVCPTPSPRDLRVNVQKDVFFERCVSVVCDAIYEELPLCFRYVVDSRNDMCTGQVEKHMCTWQVQGSHHVCLFKTRDNKTLLFSSKYNALYCVQPEFVLPSQVAPMTVLFGQFALDHVDGVYAIPHILVFDLFCMTAGSFWETNCQSSSTTF